MRSPLRFFSVVGASILGTMIALGAFLFLLFVFVMMMAMGADSSPSVRSGSVLVVDLSGPIPETASGDPLAQALMGEAPYGLYDLTSAIRSAGTDRRISGLWLRTGTLSLSWASLQAIRRALTVFHQSGKPFVASDKAFAMDERAFYLASAADSVFADPESMFELNGFGMSVTHFKGLLDRLDIKPQIVRAGTFKSAVEPFIREDMSDENRAQLQSILDDVAEEFTTVVAEARGLEPADLVTRMNENAIMTSKEAYDAGLLDGLAFDDQVRETISLMVGLDPDTKLREISIRNYVRSVSGSSSGTSGDVAVVYAVGGLVGGRSSDTPNPLFGGSTVGSETFLRAIRRARENKRTRAVVIRINSPGGFAPAADAMLREIEKTAGEMPVVISMGDVAASGGYWIATGAPTIVAESLTLTGSIGVFSMFFDVSGLLESKLGITFDEVLTSPYADMFSGLRPYTAAEEALVQRFTDQTYDAFLEKVASSRNLTIEEVDRSAQGRVWTGRAALEHGLVDELGGLEYAIEIAAQRADLTRSDVRVRVYPGPRSFLDRLNEILGVALVRFAVLFQNNAPEPAINEAIRMLSDVVRTSGSVQARLPITVTIN